MFLRRWSENADTKHLTLKCICTSLLDYTAWLNGSSVFVCPQCWRWGEALRHLQHTARLRLRWALQPIQQPQGPGAPLPPDLPGATQRLAQRAPRIPRLRTDALRTQMNPAHPQRQQTNPLLGRMKEREGGGWLKYRATPKPHLLKIDRNK